MNWPGEWAQEGRRKADNGMAPASDAESGGDLTGPLSGDLTLLMKF
jgi:hypothetical protein